MKGDEVATTTAQAPPAKPLPMVLRKVRFTREDIEFLDAKCEKDDRTFNWLVRQAVREYRERHGKKK